MQATATQTKANLETIMGAFAARIDSSAFATWIAPLKMELCQNCLKLVAQNQFTADYVKREYGEILKTIAADFSLDLNIAAGFVAAKVQTCANDNVVCAYVPNKRVQNTKQNGFDKLKICLQSQHVKKWLWVMLRFRNCLFMVQVVLVNLCY